MDQKSQKDEQTTISHQSKLPVADKSYTESSTPVKKLPIQATKHLDANFRFQTPEKTDEAFTIRSKTEPATLPEKHQILSDLFNRMTTSLRLLNLNKKLPTFQNISHQVEKLTGRKFSYRHLAQIKFVIPEAIQTERILLHNDKTLTMEPHLKVTLTFDVVEGHIEHSDYIALCNTFSSRLLKFVNAHSEDCDVPEAELSEPFNKKEIKTSSLYLDSKMEKENVPNVEEPELLNPSHLEPTFYRHFTKKDNEDAKSEKEIGLISCLDTVKHEKEVEVVNGKTPLKPKPSLLSVETPDLSTPKRSMTTEDDKESEKVMGSSLFAKRSLVFSNDDNEGVVHEEKNTPIGPKVDKDTSSCLSELVETIYNIFQSVNYSSMTKSELVHKILVNNFDIIENGEIEDQVDALEKKVPDWISKKVATSGDLMYNINKGLDLKSVTEKLK